MTIELERKQIPVLLLTGYLGSGKTTLLNRILSNRKGIRFAVIVNDIGEVNIDADLIEKGGVVGQTDDSLVALQNGCICCTLKMDLVAQLAEISAMRKFDYIVIEASGICEPAPIAQTISTLPMFGPQYVHEALPYLDCIVTVVDALRMKDEFESGGALEKEDIGEDDLERLVIEQVEFCNIVPMLRTVPNNTHASLMHRIGTDIPSLLSVNGLSLKLEQVREVEIDGFIRVVSSFALGKANIGLGTGTAPKPAVELTRFIFPSVDKPLLGETYTLVNVSDRAMTVYIPAYSQVFKTKAEKGVDGVYVVRADLTGTGTFVVEPGDSVYLRRRFRHYHRCLGAR